MSGFSGSFLRPTKNSGSFVPMYWGDGSDGVLSAGITYHAGTDYDKYSGFCIKQFTAINWVPGSPEILTVDEPCRGLILFVKGNVTIGANATISMAKLGSILQVNPSELIDLYGDSTQMRKIVDVLNSLHGGAGGNGGNGDGAGGAGGTGGAGRRCLGGIGGGGGGGTNHSSFLGGNGGSVVYPEILPGYGGHAHTHKNGWNGGGGGGDGYVNDVNVYKGGGGQALGAGGGGGGILGSEASNGEHTGGFIMIIAKGSIAIDGILDVSGGKGGNRGGSIGNYGGGGGGAGGGVIAVFARGFIDTASATKTLTGGSGGAGYQSGTAGGSGTYYEEQI